MKKMGKEVAGSDLTSSIITQDLEKSGINVFIGQRAENIASDTDLVIYSPAVPQDNVELAQATVLKIVQLSYPEFLGELSQEKFTVAVSGTNGKSTTTAILGLITEKTLDPTVIVGSRVKEWQGNLRLPLHRPTQIITQTHTDSFQHQSALSPCKSVFVVEACEWRAHMLNLSPKIIVLTNLEEDHLDYYRDINHLLATFQEYIEKLSASDLLILNNDDPNLKRLKPVSRVITYGIKNKSDVMAKNIKVGSGYQQFNLVSDLFNLKTTLKIKIPGRFNIYNCLAAISAALFLSIPLEEIKKQVEGFFGIWRRFEIINADLRGWPRGLTLISDYAHTPSAVKGTISAAKEFFPSQRLIAVFQPHHHNRTKKLFNDFVDSFNQADVMILSEIYEVAGRENQVDSDVSSRDLVKAVKLKYPKQDIYYAANLLETKNKVLGIVRPKDIVLIMGAGDIYTILDDL